MHEALLHDLTERIRLLEERLGVLRTENRLLREVLDGAQREQAPSADRHVFRAQPVSL